MMDEVLLLFTLVVGHTVVGQGRVLDDSVGTIQEGLEVIGQNPINDTVCIEEGEVDDGVTRCRSWYSMPNASASSFIPLVSSFIHRMAVLCCVWSHQI